ncbi:cytochrome c oxidase accessory protein CcoG, partial [Bacteroidota bacterium]
RPHGRHWLFRNIVGLSLLSFFFIAPVIKINGGPFLLFDLFNRKFILFSVIFWPQDSFIFFLIFISFVVFIILFTVIYGRLWCGWACPQTIFLELIFRRIEYWIEGDYKKQKKLTAQSWDFEKIWKKGLKTSLYLAISTLIINTFMAYVLSFDGLKKFWIEGIHVHTIGWIAMFTFSFIFFFIYSWFREQVCIILCPYGRLQGVMLDKKSVVISYDYNRGEPRAPFKKDENRKQVEKGACINCGNCVLVCPTGIDIRNGTQLECINCTACMDTCNDQMLKTNQPKGLIRYASEEQIEKGLGFQFSTRMIAYSLVLLGLLMFLVILLANRSPVEATILRTPGLLYQKQTDTEISNLYNLKVINKSHNNIPVEVKILSQKGTIKMVAGDIIVHDQSSAESVFFLYLNTAEVIQSRTKVTFGIFTDGQLIQKVDSWFVGP